MNQMLAKFLRFQPRHSLSAFRVHAPCKRVISSVAATRQSLTQNVPPLRSSTFSRRCFSTEESGDFGPRGRRSTIAPTKTLFVGNIPYTCDDPDIREIFSPFGQITEIRILRDRRSANHKGCAHVEFQDIESATTVFESGKEEPFFMVNRTLFLDYAEERKIKTSPPTNALYFRHFGGDIQDLREILKDYMRHVYQINFLPTRRPETAGEEEPLGHGHILFRQGSGDMATEALEKLNGATSSAGFQLNLQYSKRPSYYPQNSGESRRESE